MESAGKIGVLIPEILDSLEYELIDGIYMQAKSLGYDVLVFSDTCNAIREYHDFDYVYGLENIYQLAFMGALDGILFAAERFRTAEVCENIYAELRKLNVPCLVLEQKNPYFPYINAPQREAVKMMTEHLIREHHCRRLYCMTGFRDDLISEERLAGFSQAMNEAGLSVDESMVFYGGFWSDKPKQLALDIAAGKVPKPDAVVCANDIMAIALCDALKEQGISVPEDVAVTGYDGGWPSFLNLPRITTVAGREYELGVLSVCKLHEMMTGKTSGSNLSYQYLRYGTSCGCAAGDLHAKKIEQSSSERYLERMMYRYYDRKNYLNSDFISYMTNADSVQQLMLNISSLSYILHGVEWLDICLCEDWMFDFENPDQYRQKGFSEKMLLALSKRPFTTIAQKYTFSVRDILPVLNEPHEPQLIVLTSLHYKKQIFGYIAAAYREVKDIFVDAHYANWCDAVANGLHILQNKMYKSYVMQQFEALAIHDPVTGLYNKRGFTERLPEFLGHEPHGCICMLISYAQRTNEIAVPAVDISVLIANALRLSSDENELICRLHDTVYAVILRTGEDLKQVSERRMMLLEEKIRLLMGAAQFPQMPELTTDCSHMQFSKMSEAGALIEERLQIVLNRTEASVNTLGNYMEKLYRLRREMLSAPQKEWSISAISSAIGISNSHLQRIYRAEFGVSCKEDIIAARMKKAKWLLLHTELRVQEISNQCGYNNVSHFMRQFKDRMGISALRFRQQRADSI